jgi:hypothetical protein
MLREWKVEGSLSWIYGEHMSIWTIPQIPTTSMPLALMASRFYNSFWEMHTWAPNGQSPIVV